MKIIYKDSSYQSGSFIGNFLLGGESLLHKEMHDVFNIDNVLILVTRTNDFTEFFFFGATAENHGIINTYFNYMDYFKKFSVYFKERASRLIAIAEKDRLILPDASYAYSDQVMENKEELFPLSFLKKSSA